MGISERKEREKEQRKNDIIDAAEKIFFKKGINNSTMDEVAKEAELSKGTLYLYFKSKEEIHFELKSRALNILNKMFKESISENKTGFENCMEIGKAYVNFVNKYSNYYKVIVHFETNDCSVCSFREKCESFFKEDNPLHFFIQVIDKGIKDSSIRNDIPAKVLAQTLWAQMTGILQFISTKQKILEFTDVRTEEIVNSQFEIIKNGIRKKEG
ncbi:MAG: TetR/AcrR family transcriptional regulator [Bacteroidales bacterium]|nr:TetR/AcrR family transcriptional regulator [Bacteroidales bacterium]